MARSHLAEANGIAHGLRSGELDLLDFLGELESRFESREQAVRAFLPEEARFARLRGEAERLLQAYADADKRPPLFGVPLGVKDIFHVDGFATRAGSRLPETELTGDEAGVVSRLKAAGALVVGKTVTTEFAYFAPGPTRNPHHLEHTPGGSSSGSAAAVAAGLCLLALGTQTIGSIARPAAFCGVVGYKPSYDRISRQGVIPLAPSVDHVGLFAPDVRLAEIAAAQLCQDWSTAEGAPKPALAIPDGPYLDHASDEGKAHFRRTVDELRQAGYAVRRVKALADFEAIRARHEVIVAAEAAQVHAPWFEKYADRYHPETAELLRRGRTVRFDELEQARAGRLKLREALGSLMRSRGIDMWICPSAPGPAPRGLESTGDPVMNLPWTHSGLPTLTLPTGTTAESLPIGLQLAANWFQDERLMRWGEGIEAVVRQGGAP